MPEPASATAAASLVGAAVVVPMITAFGVPLGLRPDILIAGLSGSLVAITLLNTVPASNDTMTGLVRATLRRMAVAAASSLTAGYLTPLAMVVSGIPDPLLLGGAFVVGGGAQHVLSAWIRKFSGQGPVNGG